VIGCWEVRLAGTKVGYVDAFGLHFFRFRKDGGGRRDLDTVDTVRELHFWLLPVTGVYPHQFTGRTMGGKHPN
jgi:hypothetical protein